jgi:hypothetical protein
LVRPFTEKAADQKPKLWQKDFEERARSQNWTEHEKEIERIAAIRDEIIYNYLPEGFSADQVDDATRIIRLNNGQKLHIYQAMCRQFEKDEYDTIPECLYELKYTEPYVNLLDFIDVFCTDQKVPRFYDWKAFVKYTLKGRTLKQKYAQRSEFLEPLLQNLRRGPPRKPSTGLLPPSRTDSYRPAPRSDDRPISKRPPHAHEQSASRKRPDVEPSEAIKVELPSAPIMPKTPTSRAALKAMPPPSRREIHSNTLPPIEEAPSRHLDRHALDNEVQPATLPHDNHRPGRPPPAQQRHALPKRPDVEPSEAIKAEPPSALTRPQTPTPPVTSFRQ